MKVKGDTESHPRENKTIVYQFKVKDAKNELVFKRVCKEFFLKTLDISHGPIENVLKGTGDAGSFQEEDRKGKHEPSNKNSDEMIQIIKTHIKSFPKTESHFSRKDTKLFYLSRYFDYFKNASTISRKIH